MGVGIEPGVYVVAVSGGVDSMVLLDMLVNKYEPITNHQSPIKLVVAHYDHGIRQDSYLDRQLVQAAAKRHGLPFVYHEGDLGADASEDTARKARYAFLHQVRNASGARAVLTAHHHDDVLETAIINLLRGTNRKGLSALKSSNIVHRPLLHLPKNHLRQYARDQGLVWREDITNADPKYLRNHVRHSVIPKLSAEQHGQLVDIVRNTTQINQALDAQLLNYLHLQPALTKLSRREFLRLPHVVAREVMAAWLRRHGIRDFDQKTLERLVIAAKTAAPGKTVDVSKGVSLNINKTTINLTPISHLLTPNS